MLIRALDPIEGKEEMMANRLSRNKKGSPSKALKAKDLCSGPSKLCLSLDITKGAVNEMFLCEEGSAVWLEDAEVVPDAMVRVSKRVGIDGAGAESRDKPYRFYERGNEHVSVVDKEDRPLLKKVKSKVEEK